MVDVIDFCVPFIGENSGVLARLFFGTLRRYCDVSGTRITLHLVNKQVSSAVWADVLRQALNTGLLTRTYDVDTGWNPYRGAADSSHVDRSVRLGANFNDAALTAEWCVSNCGDADWCILSHFDVIWRGDIVRWLVETQQQTDAMMVGGHCPIMLLNRRAYRELGVSFDSEGADDVGHALARAIKAVEFDVCMEWCFHHLGGGGGYHNDEEFQSMRRRTCKIIEEQGL